MAAPTLVPGSAGDKSRQPRFASPTDEALSRFQMIEAYGLTAPGLDASAAEVARSSRRAGAAGHGLVPALEGGLLVRYRELQRLGEVHRHQGGNVGR
jgi:hypothetical protein